MDENGEKDKLIKVSWISFFSFPGTDLTFLSISALVTSEEDETVNLSDFDPHLVGPSY